MGVFARTKKIKIMSEAEKYYRMMYPDVDKLSHMDREIILLLKGYKEVIMQGQ